MPRGLIPRPITSSCRSTRIRLPDNRAIRRGKESAFAQTSTPASARMIQRPHQAPVSVHIAGHSRRRERRDQTVAKRHAVTCAEPRESEPPGARVSIIERMEEAHTSRELRRYVPRLRRSVPQLHGDLSEALFADFDHYPLGG
jgi:hypothetical protein